MNLKFATGSAFTLAIGLSAIASTAYSQECGEVYTVRAGDSLSQIASRVYGSAGTFQIIYSANSASIGPNPGVIVIGTRLDIPCLDNVSQSTADPEAIANADTTEALPAPLADVIRVVAGGNWAPFLNEEQAQGGMLAEIINVALENATDSPKYSIDFINDWGAHLTPLISDHRYDFSLAWFRPNCDIVDRLGDGSKFRCNNLLWSETLFEQILGYCTPVGEATPATYNDLFGKTICRPAGHSTFMLEEHDLVEPNVTMVRADTPQECFLGLAEGRYDLAALAVDTADGIIKSEALGDRITPNHSLSQVLTAHAVISNTNPNAEDYLKVLDDSLLEMKSNGEWFNIVRRHLSEFRAEN
ncbi:MAG: LysM peptidoglycan-binding domain-containing protein [Paracoccaceae bacterium]